MQAKLVIVEPHIQPDEYLVTLPATIGRGQEATLKLTQALISRQHCQLFADQGRLIVRDLGSLNGTFVSGQRIETAPLSSGELLTIGSVTLRVLYGDNLTASRSRKGHAVVAAVDTISLEDTAQGSHRPNEDEQLGERLDESDNDSENFFGNN